MIGAIATALLSHWRRHPGQALTLLAGLALATALWTAVQAINAEARASYAAASRFLTPAQAGTLIAPNLVAANHDHYFNFRIDFDIDQPVNKFATMEIVPAEVAADHPRRRSRRTDPDFPLRLGHLARSPEQVRETS